MQRKVERTFLRGSHGTSSYKYHIPIRNISLAVVIAWKGDALAMLLSFVYIYIYIYICVCVCVCVCVCMYVNLMEVIDTLWSFTTHKILGPHLYGANDRQMKFCIISTSLLMAENCDTRKQNVKPTLQDMKICHWMQ
jgi:hypothetical protein